MRQKPTNKQVFLWFYCYFGVRCQGSLEEMHQSGATLWPGLRLQLVQNIATRLLMGTEYGQCIIPVLKSLHLLPHKLVVEFKVCALIHKTLSLGEAPMCTCTGSDCLLLLMCEWRQTCGLLLGLPWSQLGTSASGGG